MDVDAPKGQDLAKIMEEMRANYEKIILKNQEELKTWHESKVRHNFYLQILHIIYVLKTTDNYISFIFCTDHCCTGSSDRERGSIERSQNTSQREPPADAAFGNKAAVSDWKCKRFCPDPLMQRSNISHEHLFIYF